MTLTVTRVALLQLAARVAITPKQVHIVVIASNYRLYIASLALPVACSSDVGHHPRAAGNLYILVTVVNGIPFHQRILDTKLKIVAVKFT